MVRFFGNRKSKQAALQVQLPSSLSVMSNSKEIPPTMIPDDTASLAASSEADGVTSSNSTVGSGSASAVQTIDKRTHALMETVEQLLDQHQTSLEDNLPKQIQHHQELARARWSVQNSTGAILSHKKVLRLQAELRRTNDVVQYLQCLQMHLTETHSKARCYEKTLDGQLKTQLFQELNQFEQYLQAIPDMLRETPLTITDDQIRQHLEADHVKAISSAEQ